MRSFYAKSVMLVLGAVSLANRADAQYPSYSAPSMLPSPPLTQVAPGLPTGSYGNAYSNAGNGGNRYGGSPYATNPGYYSLAAQSGSGPEVIASPSDRMQSQAPMAAPMMAPVPVPQSSGGYYPGNTNSSPYTAAMQAPYDVGANCANGACGPTGMPTCGSQGCQWYGGVGAVVMHRDHFCQRWLSYDSASPSEHILTSEGGSNKWGGGVQATIGRYFNCGNNAIQATYWGLSPGSSCNCINEAALGGGQLNTNLAFDSLLYDRGSGPVDVVTGFDAANRHRVINQDDFQNVELNILGFGYGSGMGGGCGGACGGGGPFDANCGGSCGASCSGGCNRVRFAWMNGVRYFRFANKFQYISDLTPAADVNSPDETTYHISVTNNLIGYQLGGRWDYSLGCKWTAFAQTKMGVYGNNVDQFQCVCNALGNSYISNPSSPFNGQDYHFSSHRTVTSFLGEIDLGMNYRVNKCWGVNFGYRAVAVSGVAVATSQIPTYFSDLAEAKHICANNSLFLHGAYAGVTYCW